MASHPQSPVDELPSDVVKSYPAGTFEPTRLDRAADLCLIVAAVFFFVMAGGLAMALVEGRL